MYKNKVWKLVDRKTVPSEGKRQNIIDSRWVLKKKIDSDGNLKYKADWLFVALKIKISMIYRKYMRQFLA